MSLDQDTARFRPRALGRKYRIMRSAAELGPDFPQGETYKFYFRDSVIAEKIGFRDAQAWSRAKQEHTRDKPSSSPEHVTARQLKALAIYFKLDASLGAEAWKLFLDETSIEDFHLMLISSGYGCYGVLAGSEDPILMILKEFNSFTPTLGGVTLETVSNAFRQMLPANVGEELAAAAASTIDIPEWSRVRVRFDHDGPAHVVLLDISYAATPRRFKATVLAPSFRAKTAPLAAGRSVPTEDDGHGDVFIVGPPLERHHLFGFVSVDPLPIVWQDKTNGFPVLTAAEFDRFASEVKTRGPEQVRVVHRPYRVRSAI